MSRDEHNEANRTEHSQSESEILASLQSGGATENLGSLPTEILGQDEDDDDDYPQQQSYAPASSTPSYYPSANPYLAAQAAAVAPAPYPSTSDPVQASVDAIISRVTRSQRQWNRHRLHRALKAARHVVVRAYRSQGKTVTGDAVRTEARWRVKDYVNRYNVTLPQGVFLGHDDLSAFAGEICGAFSWPWTALMPPQYQLLYKAAKTGDKQAQSLLAKAMKKDKEKGKVKSETVAEKTTESEDTAGAWMHKMNPLYWLQSEEKRKLVDTEKEAWTQHAKTEKETEKTQEVVEKAQRALEAKKAAESAKQRSAELAAQLKSIESQLSGDCGASFVGRQELLGAEFKNDNFLGSQFVGKSKSSEDDEDFATEAAPVLDKVKKAQALNTANRAELLPICKKLQSGAGLNPTETATLLTLLARNEKLHEFRKGLVSGELYKSSPACKKIQKSVMIGAVKVMTPDEQKMMAKMHDLARQGNPNAIAVLKALKTRGYAVTLGSDDSGSFLSKAFRVATAPIWLPAKGIDRLFSGKKGSSPEQVRIARMRAAAKRRAAADARLRAAEATTDAERRAAQSVADAATAEANAADAEAEAKEASMLTAEAEFAPPPEPAPADSSGLETPNKAARRALIAKKNPRVAKLIAASEENTPTGVKIRAGLTMYKSAKRGDKKAIKAARMMVAKAKKGDQQAKSDVNALLAAQMITRTETRAAKQIQRQRIAEARVAKIKAVQARYEAAMANKLIRMGRKRELVKIARVERGYSAGNKKCKLIVERTSAKAKKGDKKAQQGMTALRLARHVRTTAPTRAERRRVAQGQRLYAKAAHGNLKARRQLRILAAAEKRGNPNAKRAMKRVRTGASLERTIATGVVILPAAVVTTEAMKKSHSKKVKKNRTTVAKVETKIANGTASREEVVDAARKARELGDKETAGRLLATANDLPSAKDDLKKTARVAAASQVGNPAAQADIAKVMTAANEGQPAGIEAAGKLAGVKALDDTSKGKAMDPAMKDAVKTVEAARAGDETAAAKVAEINRVATENPTSANVEKAVALAGAGSVAAAIAATPKAREQWLTAAGVAPKTPEPELEDLQAPKSKIVTDLLPSLTQFMKSVTLMVVHPIQTYKEGVTSRQEVNDVEIVSPTTSRTGDEVEEVQKFLADEKVQKARGEVRKLNPLVSGETEITKDRHDAILKEALKTKSVKKDDVLKVLQYQKSQNPGVDKKTLVQNIGKIFSDKGVKISGDDVALPETPQQRQLANSSSNPLQIVLNKANKTKVLSKSDFEKLFEFQKNKPRNPIVKTEMEKDNWKILRENMMIRLADHQIVIK